MSLYQWIQQPLVQIPYMSFNLLCSIYGLYLAQLSSKNNQKLPELLKILSIACFFSAVLKFSTILPTGPKEWEYLKIIFLIIRLTFLYFEICFALVISVFMARVCKSSRLDSSLYAQSNLRLVFMAGIPSLLRMFGAILIAINVNPTLDSFINNALAPLDPKVDVLLTIIDFSLLAYLLYLLCCLFYYYHQLKKNSLDGSSTTLKYRLAASITINFFFITIVSVVRYIAFLIVDLCENPANQEVINLVNALISLLTLVPPMESVAMLMCMVYLSCRKQYQKNMDSFASLGKMMQIAPSEKMLNEKQTSQETLRKPIFDSLQQDEWRYRSLANHESPSPSQISDMVLLLNQTVPFDLVDFEQELF